MKKHFKNMPIDVTIDEFQELNKGKLFASWQAMTSKNQGVYLVDTKNKTLYMFDEVLEVDKIKEYGQKDNFSLLCIIKEDLKSYPLKAIKA